MSDYKTVRKDDGMLTIKAADALAAEMLIKTYVPEASQMTFAEAYELALQRDAATAAQLEQDACDAEDYEADDPEFAAMVNAAFARAEAEDLQEAEDEYRFIINALLDVPVAMAAVA